MKSIVLVAVLLVAVSAAPAEESVKAKRNVPDLGHGPFLAPSLALSAPIVAPAPIFTKALIPSAPIISAPLITKTLIQHAPIAIGAPLALGHAPLALGHGFGGHLW